MVTTMDDMLPFVCPELDAATSPADMTAIWASSDRSYLNLDSLDDVGKDRQAER